MGKSIKEEDNLKFVVIKEIIKHSQDIKSPELLIQHVCDIIYNTIHMYNIFSAFLYNVAFDNK